MVPNRVLALLAVVPLISGCAQPASADLVRSTEPREVDVDVSSDAMEALIEGNAEFAFDLYQLIGDDTDNLLFSPHSMSLALAMTYAGARGETAEGMASAMHYKLPQEQLHPAFNRLDQDLSSRGNETGDEVFQLNVANAIWGQTGYSFRDEYLDTIASNYGAGLRTLDFQSGPEESRLAINDWVEEQTEERIKDLLPRGAIDTLTRLVLTNAIYFNAAWASQFEVESTTEGTFNLIDGSQIMVPMMSQDARFRYTDADGFKAIELPYVGQEISMVILVPDEGEFGAFQDSLDFDVFQHSANVMERTQVSLVMPRFSVETSFSLVDALSEMGMEDAFDPERADFSGINGTHSLYITAVVHKAFVDVDEAGTEAAAATGVVLGETAAPIDPVQVTIDRPFVYAIRDIESGAILFLGRVTNPA